jgi:beta-mannosidase
MHLPLDRSWRFCDASTRRWRDAKVPGCIHIDLLRHHLIPDPFWGSNEHRLDWIEKRDWIYRCCFKEGGILSQKNVDLVAEGLDTVATLCLNGHRFAQTESMFIGYRFPIRKWLRPGDNELEIRFHSPLAYIRRRRRIHSFCEWNDPLGGCSNIRKEQCSFGWDWGPRFPTCGIYRSIGFHAWSGNRIESIRVMQEHKKGLVRLRLFPTLARPTRDLSFEVRLLYGGYLVTRSNHLQLDVQKPCLWWPNGLGAQPLYELVVTVSENGRKVDTWRRRIGFRTIQLDRRPDRWGESFQFRINGTPFFAKGANWIPAHSFVAAVRRATYDDLLNSAKDANMNMLRVWGGGIYEADDFYDLCDEKGLLVWQDFMFACSLYPGDRHFLDLIDKEVSYQVRRLAHHASLALWCGNNEIECMPQEICRTSSRRRSYRTVFYRILPDAVRKHDGQTPYWPASPHDPNSYLGGARNEWKGDCHYWGVWHSRKPVRTYEALKNRFISEFGMQSYSSPRVASLFCPPDQMNIFGPAMENHQKNAAGNQIILDYLSRRYRYAKDYASLAYLSQLNQAYCVKVGVEHFRRSMPRTMGALYWQLNDCWPVFSWSSIEFGGEWKALHHEARRFFAPALVTALVTGDETVGIGNLIKNTIRRVKVYTVYDGVTPLNGRVHWTLYHLNGKMLKNGTRPVCLRYGQSRRQLMLDFKREIDRYGHRQLVLRLALMTGGCEVSSNTVFFTSPRFMELSRTPVSRNIRQLSSGDFRVLFKSRAFHHQLSFEIDGVGCRSSDNFFDLFPHMPHPVVIRPSTRLSRSEFIRRFRIRSLADTY